MKKQNKVLKDEYGFLLPESLETEAKFINRFIKNEDMKMLVPERSKRLLKSISLFKKECISSLVTVTLADGTKYFIK